MGIFMTIHTKGELSSFQYQYFSYIFPFYLDCMLYICIVCVISLIPFGFWCCWSDSTVKIKYKINTSMTRKNSRRWVQRQSFMKHDHWDLRCFHIYLFFLFNYALWHIADNCETPNVLEWIIQNRMVKEEEEEEEKDEEWWWCRRKCSTDCKLFGHSWHFNLTLRCFFLHFFYFRFKYWGHVCIIFQTTFWVVSSPFAILTWLHFIYYMY